jgi:hypothetical protein
MPRALWALLHERPRIQIAPAQYPAGQRPVLDLLADSGAGSNNSGFELILEESDCLKCGGRQTTTIHLGGAFSGPYPLYLLQVQIPQLGFARRIPAVGVPRMSAGFRGIACFRFLNRFTYGNFGHLDQFGLET